MDHIIIFVTFVFLSFLFIKKWQHEAYEVQKIITKKTILRKYHIHHTFIGPLLFLIGITLKPIWISAVVMGIGSGLFIHGAILNGLYFITKVK